MPTALRTVPVALALLLAACAENVAVETPSEQATAPATASPTSRPGTSPDLAEIVSGDESSATAFGAADLSRIVLSEEHLEPGWTLDDLTSGFSALLQPIVLLEPEFTVFAEQPGFVDARMTRIGTTGQGSYWEVGDSPVSETLPVQTATSALPVL